MAFPHHKAQETGEKKSNLKPGGTARQHKSRQAFANQDEERRGGE
jgi:hypothetical protein